MHETGAASLLAGSKAYALKWADTEAAAELRQQLPLAKTFTELNGSEKYYKLPKHLTVADEDVREIHKGDVMLFDGQYVVVFYQDFQTTYRYTRLGHVEAANDLDAALGAGDVFLTLQP
ncbi:cyclophilin-like fold protein [Dialister succinatiphilus]|uniref:cyclophilin-like fold protein n=1 Tax=Dialister succinatiphilus TaxID=487173 RepID=UPI004025D168